MKTPMELGLPEKFLAWRPGQAELVEQIASSLKKVFLLDAPTGTGKSLVGIAVHQSRILSKASKEVLARLSGKSTKEFEYKCIFVTRTKQLQEQICVGPLTRILTADLRWVEAQTITEGDILMGFDERAPGAGNRRKWRKSVVESANRVEQPRYRLTFNDGTTIICSDKHLWLVVSFQKQRGQSSARWVKTSNLRDSSSGKYASKISRLLDVWEKDDSRLAGYVAAGFDGEGHFHQETPVRGKGSEVALIFSQTPNEMLSQMIQYLNTANLRYRKYIHTHANDKWKDCINLEINNRPDIFRLLGQMRPVRLLAKFDPDKMGSIFNFGQAALLKKEYLGVGEVVTIQTSTRTFVAEGLASHNCAEFPHAKTMKGRNNYPCLRHEKNFPDYTAEDCTHSDSNLCEHRGSAPGVCPYLLAKFLAMKAPLAVLNTRYFLAEVNGPGGFSGADLLIIDEVDALENELMSHIQLKITTKQLHRFGLEFPKDPHSLQGWLSWASVLDLYQKTSRMQELLDAVPEKDWSDIEIEMHRQANRLRTFETKVKTFVNEVNDSWIFSEEQNEGDTIWTFKPVKVDAYALPYLWRHAKRFLGMSGTILDPKIMADDVGIEEWDYTSSDSPFPLSNRPIYYMPVVNLSRDSLVLELPVLAKAVGKIMERYPDEKILVHTTSFFIRDYLKDKLDAHRVITHTTQNREEMLNCFKRAQDPVVMLSPSFDRGVDLPDDLCRCIVICKCPYSSLGDPQVKARMKMPGGQRWYLLKAAQSIMQMSGRGVRSHLDHCDCFILDKQFGVLLGRMRQHFPKWWLDAIQRSM